MSIKTILVDDEQLARQRMRTLLAEHADIEIVAECITGQQARAMIEQHNPDLVILDVQMPRMNGLKLLQVLAETQLPLVVFVSAHEEFAVEAFDTRAVDYLLKPVRPERLARALGRVSEQLAAIRDPHVPAHAPDVPGERIVRLMARSNNRVVIIKSEEIDSIESAGNYVIVHVGGERYIIRETMSSLERGLPPENFVRLNRSLIVNASRIVELRSIGDGEFSAVLHNGKTAVITIGLRELERRLKFAR